jgi:large repetitive protein
VQLDPTLTTVTSAPNPSTVGDMVTITVTVKAASPGSGNPTGTVTILVDGKAAASVALDSHVDSRAVYSLSSLAVGVHAITATYNGDVGYAGSSAVVADSQSVVPLVAVPVTGNVFSGWAAIAALGLVINGLALIAWTRRRRRL